MRYYSFALNTSAEKLKENSKVNLREYAYENPIAAMNNYIYKKSKNGLCFLAYREEEAMTLAVFSYDERKLSYHESYEYILEILHDTFGVNKIVAEPYQITMFQFFECVLEAHRREYQQITNRYLKTANLGIYNYYYNEAESFHYNLEEKIVSENNRKENLLYDQSFIKELSNIEAHQNVSEHKGNIVHYIIASRGIEAAIDMAENLTQTLAKANRISGRRMEIISNIEPDLCRINNHLEEIIENNYGGVVLFDLSEKFGFDPVDYGMTSRYIESLVKKYRNDCLFIFTYNMENPGFSYQILPQLKKYVIPVMLREGT
ncbi:MAG: hypothetical protein IIW54_06665, partial [Lachnospiraceae bacterium]|nr:hypothetical protein [Lachnospiraceae bacterium]